MSPTNEWPTSYPQYSGPYTRPQEPSYPASPAKTLTPTVGRMVHYTSYGTPGGEYPVTCRAAVVTEAINRDTVSLAVLNPEGMYFNKGVVAGRAGGTWHWPELTEMR